MTNYDTINFNKQSAEDFRTTYKNALSNNIEVFSFQGADFLTTYAKYMCEYLVNRGLLSDEEKLK